MPFEIAEEHDYLVIRLTGVVAPADLVGMAEVLREYEERSHPRDRLIDLTAIESTTIAYAEVAELADNRRKLPFAAWIRSAILTARPMQYGFARMFQTLNDNPRIEIRIFNDRLAAMNWIRPGPLPGPRIASRT